MDDVASAAPDLYRVGKNAGVKQERERILEMLRREEKRTRETEVTAARRGDVSMEEVADVERRVITSLRECLEQQKEEE